MINELEVENNELKNKLQKIENELNSHKVRVIKLRKRKKHRQVLLKSS